MQTHICVMNKKQLFHWTMCKKHVFVMEIPLISLNKMQTNSVVVENTNYFIRPCAKIMFCYQNTNYFIRLYAKLNFFYSFRRRSNKKHALV